MAENIKAYSPLAFAFIGEPAEQRKKEEREDIVQRHNNAGQRLRHAEFIGQNLGNDRVVCLPEGADEEKCEPNEDRALIVQFHICPRSTESHIFTFSL